MPSIPHRILQQRQDFNVLFCRFCCVRQLQTMKPKNTLLLKWIHRNLHWTSVAKAHGQLGERPRDPWAYNLAKEIDLLIPSVSDMERPHRIYRVIQTFASLDKSKSELPGTDDEDLADTSNKAKDTTLDEGTKSSDGLTLAIHKVREKSLQQTKQFSKQVTRLAHALINNHQLVANSATTDNVIAVASNIMSGNIGFGIKTISRLLAHHHDIFLIDYNVLKSRIQNLRNNRLNEGFLQRSISLCPSFLKLSESTISDVTDAMMGELDFKSAEMQQLFLYSSQIFFEPFEVTEDKFCYIYFNMGYKKHYVIARHGLLRYPLQHLRTRHLFLERRGQYQLADKFMNTNIILPNMKPMLCSSDLSFCSNVALCKLGEYQLFKQVLLVEDAVRDEDPEQEPAKSWALADKLLSEMK